MVEACKLMELGQLQQTHADAWVAKRMASASNKQKAEVSERTLSDASGRDFCRITRAGGSIKLKLLSDAVDHERVVAAIQAAIERELGAAAAE